MSLGIELTNQQTQPSKNSNKVWGDFFGGGFFCRKVFLCLIFAWGWAYFLWAADFFCSYAFDILMVCT
jgi:hypothetical protein